MRLQLGPMEDPGKMKVADLRASLERRGLNTSGLKQVLQERLAAAMVEAGIGAEAMVIDPVAVEAVDAAAVEDAAGAAVEDAAGAAVEDAADAAMEGAVDAAVEGAADAAAEMEVPVDAGGAGEAAVEVDDPVDTVEMIALGLAKVEEGYKILRVMINDNEHKNLLIEQLDCITQVGY